LEEDRKDVVRCLNKGIADPACGVRGASAWVAGQLRIKELLPGLSSTLKEEKDNAVKKAIAAIQ